jgi:hypothetical protein
VVDRAVVGIRIEIDVQQNTIIAIEVAKILVFCPKVDRSGQKKRLGFKPRRVALDNHGTSNLSYRGTVWPSPLLEDYFFHRGP